MDLFNAAAYAVKDLASLATTATSQGLGLNETPPSPPKTRFQSMAKPQYPHIIYMVRYCKPKMYKSPVSNVTFCDNGLLESTNGEYDSIQCSSLLCSAYDVVEAVLKHHGYNGDIDKFVNWCSCKKSHSWWIRVKMYEKGDFHWMDLDHENISKMKSLDVRNGGNQFVVQFTAIPSCRKKNISEISEVIKASSGQSSPSPLSPMSEGEIASTVETWALKPNGRKKLPSDLVMSIKEILSSSLSDRLDTALKQLKTSEIRSHDEKNFFGHSPSMNEKVIHSKLVKLFHPDKLVGLCETDKFICSHIFQVIMESLV